MIEPVYQTDRVTVYHGDCLDIMPQLDAASIDAVVTDPPYGINLDYDAYEDTEDKWTTLMDAAVPMMRSIAKCVVMPTCRIKALEWWYTNHPPDWLIAWYKGSPGHMSYVGFND